MSGWDEGNQRMEGMPIRAQEPGSNEPEILKARFANFLKNFTENAQNFFLYREQLVSQNEGQLEGNAFIRVQLDHLIMFDRDLSERLIATPAKIIDDFEKAASQLYFELTQNRREDDSLYQFQVQFYSKAGANAVRNNIRTLGSGDVTKLVVLDGIIIRAAPPKAKARSIIVRCRKCQETMQRIYVRPGVGGFTYPRYCRNASCDKPQDSLYIVPELGEYVDQQQLRLQELPESVPPSEMPRHVSMTVDRALVNSIAAGVRVRIVGIYSIFTAQSRGPSEKLGNGAIAVKQTYLRVIGLQALPSPASGRSVSAEFSPEEEAQFRELSMAPDIYDRISRSIAPSIYGLEDQKKAVACLLFGGARKKLPDGMTLRGDINVLLLGDPATAKSQLLKFAERVAPICIYTSGKGSSAAGLTASVVRDAGSGEWQLEAGAMVLADGGVVCIDEFDKMREEDRVAIHEAMEQQTISIAKAGITTILNSRTSVLAAANPSFGRYDDMKTAAEQIDFQTTILSRFDLIFVVKDSRVEAKDKRMARHIMNLHMGMESAEQVGDIDIPVLKRYIEFCRTRVSPRLTVDACESLRNQFVAIRNDHRKNVREGSVIPITIRQLEAIVRLSESIARMACTPDVTDAHVAEAFRLFRVSTLDAASTGLDIDGSSANDADFINKVTEAEKWIRGRMAVGSSIPERILMDTSVRQGMQMNHVRKALQVMLNRGQLVVRAQGNLLTRTR